MLLIIDNYDSFTYNLAQYFAKLDADVVVRRNDALTLEEIMEMPLDRLVISPGPCDPPKAGISLDVLDKLSGKLPILGVCLGHQAVGHAFGGRVIRAPRLMHGKTSLIYHDGKTIFKDIPSPFTAIRYHSLIVERETLPECLEISAWTEEGEIMGVRHREYPVEGVQFHPESILTEHGYKLLDNFLQMKFS